jgi:hypothetical protein
MRGVVAILFLLGFIIFIAVKFIFKAGVFVKASAQGDFRQALASVGYSASPAQIVTGLAKRVLLQTNRLSTPDTPVALNSLKPTALGYLVTLTMLLSAKNGVSKSTAVIDEVEQMYLSLFGTGGQNQVRVLVLTAMGNRDRDFIQGYELAHKDFEVGFLHGAPVENADTVI